jgi:hypothetical protein
LILVSPQIIVARLLYDAKLIGGHLFAALVLAAAFTEVTVPLLFAIVVSRCSEQLRT